MYYREARPLRKEINVDILLLVFRRTKVKLLVSELRNLFHTSYSKRSISLLIYQLGCSSKCTANFLATWLVVSCLQGVEGLDGWRPS
jgi:hypothetical protein